MTEPAPFPSEAPRAPERSGSGWLAVLAAAIVFGGFVAYGLLAPATYRTTAQVVVKSNDGGPAALAATPAPLARLREAAVDTETLEQTAAALALGSGAAAQAAARQRIDAALEMQSPRPDTFEFSFRAPTAEAAKRVTDLLARHAAARAVHALTPPAVDEAAAREAARNKSAAELAAFMAKHPELSPAPVVAPVGPKDAAPETDAAALRAERDQLQAKLVRLPEAGSDNPFGEPTQASPEAMRMRRRISEIDTTLKARQKAEKKADTGPKIAPEVDREWKRLVQAVAQPVVTTTTAPTPSLTVTLQEARLPSAPIDPNRRAITLFGAVAALLTGLGVALTQALVGRGRPATTTAPQWGSEPPRYGSEPPRPGSEPPRYGSEPPRPGSEPPRPGSEPPRYGSEPPRPGSDPPRYGSEPPRPGSDPPGGSVTDRAGSEPPRVGSDPPRPGSDTPLPANHPALAATQAVPQAVTTAQPIVQISGTQPVGGDGRRSSSNPPRPGSDPPRRSPASSNPPAPPAVPSSDAPHAAPPQTVTRPSVKSPLPPRTAVGLAPPSPPPVPPAAPEAPQQQASAPAGLKASKGTLVGMPLLEQAALQAAVMATPTVDATPAARDRDAPRSTLRPPPTPPKGPPTEPAVAAEVIVPKRSDAPTTQRPSSNPPGTSPSDEPPPISPGRPARRSSARRTTQVLGSPIPPVTRSSRPPVAHRQSPPPGVPTTYSYSDRPEEAVRRTHMDTPPYYQMPRGERSDSVTPPQGYVQTAPPGANQPSRVRITKQPVRTGWIADPSLDFRARRPLSDQLFPLAVERCFVVGVSAVEEARKHKSRVAAELALALAEPRQQRVLLLEADFQWPEVHRTLRIDMPMSLGFSQQLSTRTEGRAEGWTVIECSPTLHVLAEGIMRSPGLILSVRFEESILSLRSYYDLIVIDGPSASAEVDSRALAGVIDGAIVVSPAAGAPSLARACSLFADKAFSTVVGV